MLISGIQKLSLVDFPGKVACTVFTGGCTLRCPYCHNSELITNPPKLMEVDELLAFLAKRTGMLDGVCVTGGEPCIHADLPDLLTAIGETGLAVKLDTSGVFPDRLAQILDARLVDYVALDVKNSPERYAETTGTEHSLIPLVRQSICSLARSGVEYELRTTVVEPLVDKDSVIGIRDFLAGVVDETGIPIPRMFLQAFQDRETVPFAGLTTPTEESLRHYAEILGAVVGEVQVRGV